MIRLIGFNKILLILVLGGLLAALGFYYYMVSTPQIDKNNKELRRSNAEISEITTNLSDLKLGIEKFTQQEQDFKQLEKYGFFDPQDRVQARKKLNHIKDISGVMAAQYTIKSAQTDKNEKIAAAGYKILNTPMEFDLDALDDKEIYRFIYYLNYGFPGQISIEEISITRDENITFERLKAIGLGLEPLEPLVKSRILANWRTIVPDTAISVDGGLE